LHKRTTTLKKPTARWELSLCQAVDKDVDPCLVLQSG